jgi:hypothetical protein
MMINESARLSAARQTVSGIATRQRLEQTFPSAAGKTAYGGLKITYYSLYADNFSDFSFFMIRP